MKKSKAPTTRNTVVRNPLLSKSHAHRSNKDYNRKSNKQALRSAMASY